MNPSYTTGNTGNQFSYAAAGGSTTAGGFVNSPGTFGASQTSPDQKRTGSQNMAMRPVTVKQVESVNLEIPDQPMSLDGAILSHVGVLLLQWWTPILNKIANTPIGHAGGTRQQCQPAGHLCQLHD
jgi:hypothetical protein